MSPTRLLVAAVAVPTLALSLACAGLFEASTVQATASDVGCGRVAVVADTTGAGEAVILAGGRELARWPIQGEMQQRREVEVPPTVSEVQVRIVGTSVATTVPVSTTPPTLSVVPQTGPVGSTTRVQLDAACTSRTGLAVRAIIDGKAVPDASVGPDATAVLPDLTLGEHALRVSVVADGTVLGTSDLTVVREPAPPVNPDETGRDADGDGYASVADGGSDCNDGDPSIHPDQPEIPDQRDQDCDGVVDEGTPIFDDDGDGMTEEQGDCDDADPSVHPGARERPDCRDQDCDGEIDEGVQRPAVDDSLEPNDTREQALDLKTEGRRAFSRTLSFVTRGEGDEEWFRFHSDDGPFDLWGIDVVGTSVGEGMSYDVEIHHEGFGLRKNGPLVHGEGVHIIGRPLASDTGHYVVRVRPTVVARPWCPLVIHLHSG